MIKKKMEYPYAGLRTKLAPNHQTQPTNFCLYGGGKNLLFPYKLKCCYFVVKNLWVWTTALHKCPSMASVPTCRVRDGLGGHLRNCFERGRFKSVSRSGSGRTRTENNSSAPLSFGKGIFKFNFEINRSALHQTETGNYLQICFFVSQFCHVFQRDVRVLQTVNKIK